MVFMGQALKNQIHQLDPEADQHLLRRNRLGPRPLPLHLMTALCVWPSLPIVWPNLKNVWPSSNPNLTPALQKLRAAASHTNPAFETALAEEAVRRTRSFLSAIRLYQNHPDHRDVPEAPVIWQQGTTCLRDYNPFMPAAPIVLVIPSLINRLDILDLDLAPSFLRTLAMHGLRPVVVDWDTPGDAEKNFGLADYVTKRLVPALRFLESKNSAPVHVLGYCMGGLLALALAQLQQENVKTLALMATPWDFHKPDSATGTSLAALADDLEPCLQKMGQLPVDIVQSLFSTLQPLQVLEKFRRFAGMNQLSMEARKFVLVEDWLNDGVPLTANVARECLRDWYGNNTTANGTWTVDSQIIDPCEVSIPTYIIVPGKDKIVPPESALSLVKLLPHATLHEPMSGHIGLLASRHASQYIWAPLIHWLKEHV